MMYLLMPDGSTSEVKSMQQACIEYKKACDNYPGEPCKDAGDLRGGRRKFFIGNIDKHGDIYTGNSWPYTRKIFSYKESLKSGN